MIRNSAVVTGKTNKVLREKIISDFKDGTIKYVFNVGVLTTGFDHPSLDCIVLLRPTKSITLYYQMLGRGVRTAAGKKHCKIIDLTSTVQHLGRVETIQLLKEKGKWELISETGRWHNQQLYRYTIEVEKKKKEEGDAKP
jgi:DNA repair protein RadD